MNNKKDFKKIFDDVKDESSIFSAKEKEDGKFLSVLCYFSFLILIPFLVEKKNLFVAYHIKQGLNLLIVEIVCGIAINIINFTLLSIFSIIPNIISSLLEILLFILAIIGISNALNGRAREIPIINKFKIIK